MRAATTRTASSAAAAAAVAASAASAAAVRASAAAAASRAAAGAAAAAPSSVAVAAAAASQRAAATTAAATSTFSSSTTTSTAAAAAAAAAGSSATATVAGQRVPASSRDTTGLPPPAERKRVLVTGAQGQIGSELVRLLRARGHFVLATDIARPTRANAGRLSVDHEGNPLGGARTGEESRFLDPSRRFNDTQGGFKYLDVLDHHAVRSTIVDHGVDTILHLSTLLSAVGEKFPKRALDVNINGLNIALEAAKDLGCAIYAPSSMAAFGPSTPRDPTPDLTIMRPTTIYGISKVYGELLGQWYADNHGVDFRSIRYPGVLSAETLPGGGTTDYAIEIFHDALTSGHHDCFLAEDSALPMIHIEDTLRGTVQLVEADRARLTQTTYNMHAVSFTPKEIYELLRDRHCPDLTIAYKPDFRQKIAETWPIALDDSKAREDWDWQHDYDTPGLVDSLYHDIKALHYSDKKE